MKPGDIRIAHRSTTPLKIVLVLDDKTYYCFFCDNFIDKKYWGLHKTTEPIVSYENLHVVI